MPEVVTPVSARKEYVKMTADLRAKIVAAIQSGENNPLVSLATGVSLSAVAKIRREIGSARKYAKKVAVV
jgi:hypothetical protein